MFKETSRYCFFSINTFTMLMVRKRQALLKTREKESSKKVNIIESTLMGDAKTSPVLQTITEDNY